MSWRTLLDATAERAVVAAQAPGFIPPMLATLTDQPFDDPDWVFERKLDGVRLIAVVAGGKARLFSRNRNRLFAYPEIEAALPDAVTEPCVLDGEVVAWRDGQTSFELLQGRMQKNDPEAARATGIEVEFHVFDVLQVGKADVTRLPLLQRKQVLEEVVRFAHPLVYSPHSARDGTRFLKQACQAGWEGLIAKRADSPYRVGKRSRDWLKLKCSAGQEFVIGGFTDPRGARVGFGALLLGYHEDGRLRYAGKVGTGFDQRLLLDLRARLDALERRTSPFADDVAGPGMHWVTPKLICEVEFTEWTGEGRLRHPRFKGLRRDKAPQEVTRER